MGRKKLAATKEQMAGRVASPIKAAVEALAKKEKRTLSQMLEILLEESPRIKTALRKT